MKRLAALPLLCAASAFSVSCNNSPYPYKAQTPPTSAYYRPVATTSRPTPMQEAETKKVQIISEPAGARIEVNDNYVGDAPITIELSSGSGQFATDTVIRAIPTESGDFVQMKHFKGRLAADPWTYQRAEKGDEIPSRIFFDMHLGPPTPAVDVNVNPPN